MKLGLAPTICTISIRTPSEEHKAQKSPVPEAGRPPSHVLEAVLVLGVILSEEVAKLFQAMAGQALKSTRGGRVQCLPVVERQAMIRDLPGEGMLEHVDGLPLDDFFVEEL